ncbi:MAG: hypothetical protein ACOVQA_13455 [Thermoflexibacteraceae bacterium]|jgi:hypothetical protein
MQKLFLIAIFYALFSAVPLLAQVENENHGVIDVKLENLLQKRSCLPYVSYESTKQEHFRII